MSGYAEIVCCWAFTPAWFNLVESLSGSFPPLVQLVWPGVNAAISLGCRPKADRRSTLRLWPKSLEVMGIRFQANSAAVRLWCERDQSSIRPNGWKNGAVSGLIHLPSSAVNLQKCGLSPGLSTSLCLLLGGTLILTSRRVRKYVPTHIWSVVWMFLHVAAFGFISPSHHVIWPETDSVVWKRAATT